MVEVMLCLPVILAAFGGTIFVAKFMKQRGQVEQALADSVRHCSRTELDDDLIACVQTRVTESVAASLCQEMEPPTVQVISHSKEYDDPELFQNVSINLRILKAKLECGLQIKVPLLDLG